MPIVTPAALTEPPFCTNVPVHVCRLPQENPSMLEPPIWMSRPTVSVTGWPLPVSVIV